MALVFLSFLAPCISHAQSRNVVCREGNGEFEAEFQTGVRLRVGAGKNEEFAARNCQASFTSGNQKVVVADGASQLDLDAFGVDLGLGAPVAALQVKKFKADCCMEYDIYSLRAPPVLLRRITGGDFFSAADTDLEGRVEIWTDDATAADGFENFHSQDLDFAPPVVLRFSNGRLLDVGAEFQAQFDQKIADVRAKLDPRDLADFKNSDGRLSSVGTIPAVRLIQLRGVKAKVLEIVWCYLYSGREQQAWRSLAEMWPPADYERIRAALLSAHAHGMRSQVDGVAAPIRADRKNHAKIYDGTTTVAPTPGLTPKDVKPKLEITPPRAILMERQVPETDLEKELAQSESLLLLVVDSAGKVRSVEEQGNFQAVDEGLIRSTSNWKFIPAYMKGEPVASRIYLGVSLRR